jgi:hypothetical protein
VTVLRIAASNRYKSFIALRPMLLLYTCLDLSLLMVLGFWCDLHAQSTSIDPRELAPRAPPTCSEVNMAVRQGCAINLHFRLDHLTSKLFLSFRDLDDFLNESGADPVLEVGDSRPVSRNSTCSFMRLTHCSAVSWGSGASLTSLKTRSML